MVCGVWWGACWVSPHNSRVSPGYITRPGPRLPRVWLASRGRRGQARTEIERGNNNNTCKWTIPLWVVCCLLFTYFLLILSLYNQFSLNITPCSFDDRRHAPGSPLTVAKRTDTHTHTHTHTHTEIRYLHNTKLITIIIMIAIVIIMIIIMPHHLFLEQFITSLEATLNEAGK